MSLTTKNFILAAVAIALGVGGYQVMRSKAASGTQPGQEKSQGKSPEKSQEKSQTVRTASAEKNTIPVTLTANGYVTAINTVDVQPRIQQIVRTVHVKEGQDVRAGQLLFTLDSRNDSSSVDKAQAQVARDRADLEDAEITLKRNLELAEKKFVSQAVVDTARNKVDSLRATLRSDQAAVESSNITLNYNQISASISGRIGTINVHPGSLAQPAAATPMVTITQLDPVAVSFSVPERELATLNATYPNGDAPVFAQLPGGSEFPGGADFKGKLIFIDNSADPQSGTIRMKAQFDNSRRQLWPGTFVNVRLVSRTLPDAIVVPAQAIVTGPSYQFVYLAQPDGTVQAQKVEVLALDNGRAAVSGLPEGARVVVEGTQNLRPGSKIKEAQAATPEKNPQDPSSKDQSPKDPNAKDPNAKDQNSKNQKSAS